MILYLLDWDGWIVALAFLGLIIVISFTSSYIKNLFVKGEISLGYFFIDNNTQVLYLINKYESNEWARTGGSYRNCTHKIEKFNLATLKRQFETKISFTSYRGIGGGSGEPTGIDNNYLYSILSEKKLVIIDMKTGKKVANKRTILSKNKSIKDINLLDSKYCNTKKSLIVHDHRGRTLFLDMKDMRLKPFGHYLNDEDTGINLTSIEDIGTVKLEPAKKHVENSQTDDSEIKTGADNGFNTDNRTPKLIIAYPPKNKIPDEEIQVVAMAQNGSELWNHSLGELFVKPKIDGNHRLAYTDVNDTILFILLSGKPHRISMSRVDKNSGEILQGPMRSINRKIRKIGISPQK